MSVENVDQTPEKKESTLKKILKTVIPLTLGIVILWYLYRGTNFDEMWNTIKDANVGLLLFALIFAPIGNAIRGIRWKLIIEPLGYKPSTSNLIYAVYGNYAINYVLPRAGEIWRCGMIAKTEKIPFVKLIGTLLIDRVFDTLMVIIITLVACCFNFDFFANYIKENQSLSDSVSNLFHSQWLYIGLGVIVAIFYLIFGVFKNTKPVVKLKTLFKDLGKDMALVLKMKKKKLFLVYTVAIWVAYFLYFYINFFAFDFTKDLGLTAGLIAFAISSLSMGLPTNGGIGVWHAAVVLSLSLYGISKAPAEAFAFGVFAIQSFWTVLYGLFGVLAISLKKQKQS